MSKLKSVVLLSFFYVGSQAGFSSQSPGSSQFGNEIKTTLGNSVSGLGGNNSVAHQVVAPPYYVADLVGQVAAQMGINTVWTEKNFHIEPDFKNCSYDGLPITEENIDALMQGEMGLATIFELISGKMSAVAKSKLALSDDTTRANEIAIANALEKCAGVIRKCVDIAREKIEDFGYDIAVNLEVVEANLWLIKDITAREKIEKIIYPIGKYMSGNERCLETTTCEQYIKKLMELQREMETIEKYTPDIALAKDGFVIGQSPEQSTYKGQSIKHIKNTAGPEEIDKLMKKTKATAIYQRDVLKDDLKASQYEDVANSLYATLLDVCCYNRNLSWKVEEEIKDIERILFLSSTELQKKFGGIFGEIRESILLADSCTIEDREQALEKLVRIKKTIIAAESEEGASDSIFCNKTKTFFKPLREIQSGLLSNHQLVRSLDNYVQGDETKWYAISSRIKEELDSTYSGYRVKSLKNALDEYGINFNVINLVLSYKNLKKVDVIRQEILALNPELQVYFEQFESRLAEIKRDIEERTVKKCGLKRLNLISQKEELDVTLEKVKQAAAANEALAEYQNSILFCEKKLCFGETFDDCTYDGGGLTKENLDLRGGLQGQFDKDSEIKVIREIREIAKNKEAIGEFNGAAVHNSVANFVEQYFADVRKAIYDETVACMAICKEMPDPLFIRDLDLQRKMEAIEERLERRQLINVYPSGGFNELRERIEQIKLLRDEWQSADKLTLQEVLQREGFVFAATPENFTIKGYSVTDEGIDNLVRAYGPKSPKKALKKLKKVEAYLRCANDPERAEVCLGVISLIAKYGKNICTKNINISEKIREEEAVIREELPLVNNLDQKRDFEAAIERIVKDSKEARRGGFSIDMFELTTKYLTDLTEIGEQVKAVISAQQ